MKTKNILGIIFVLISIFLVNIMKAEELSNNFELEYKILKQSEISPVFGLNFSHIYKSSSESSYYIIGFINPKKGITGNHMIEIDFYNPDIKSSIISTKIGWISQGRFFLVFIGDIDRYSKIEYKIKVIMKK